MTCETETLQQRLDCLIREVMQRRFYKEPLLDEKNMHLDLGIDSLGLMSLAFRVEEEFGIDVLVHADRLENIFTVGELRSFVSEFAREDAE